MKRFLINNSTILVLGGAVVIWRLLLLIPLNLTDFISQRNGYIGPSLFANFDGVHYLSIAQNGYFQYEQAFFPLFPLLISLIGRLVHNNYLWAGFILVYSSLAIALIYFWKLLRIDYAEKIATYTMLFLVGFPTAFFLVSIYSESLFLAFTFAFFYYLRKKKWLLAGCIAIFASATRIVGVLLIIPFLLELYPYIDRKRIVSLKTIKLAYPIILVPLGTVFYMVYLWVKYQDPLLFYHSESAFGANRTSEKLIFLPQVIYRYIKIFLTVPIRNIDFWIALLELVTLVGVAVGLYLAYKAKVRISYILFAAISLLLPTFTGTLSALPRYALGCFAIFILLAKTNNSLLRSAILLILLLFQFLLAALFFRGYYIA